MTIGQMTTGTPREPAKPLTVRDLIAALQALPPDQQDLRVVSDGCDCEGDAGRVRVCGEAEPYVLIERVDNIG